MKKNLFRIVILVSCLYSIISFAFDSLSYIPRVYLEGMMGDELLGQGDILVPLKLSNDKSLFLYGQGRVSTPEDENVLDHAPWTGSLGIGSRKIYGNRLLGAYVLGDYSGTSGGFNYWDVSPGVEMLGKVWDFRANGYFPIGKHSWSKEDWADKFGVYDYVKYTGHNEYDRWAAMNQEIVSGGDVEIGRKLFKQKNTLVKAYLGSYYFDMKENKDIIGARARITFQPSQFITFSINDTYDRQYHNTLMFGMRIRLNDLVNRDPEYKVTEDKDLSVRLLDPMERNIGSIAYATSIPVSKKIKPGDWGLEHDNIWFFRPGSAKKGHLKDDEDGTYEHPFDGFNQDTKQYVEDHYGEIGAHIDLFPLLYFAQGQYDLGSGDFPSSRFSLPMDWGMYGRTDDYIEPAQGDLRPRFIGGLDLHYGNNVLDSIWLVNNEGNSKGTPQETGINITGSNVYMNNIRVGALNSSEGYPTGISINSAQNVTLNGSQVYGYGVDVVVKGIDLSNGSELTLGDGNNIATSNYNYPTRGINAYNSTVNISGSGNIISATTTGVSGGYVNGISAEDSTVNISGSGNSISATATGGVSSGEAHGIVANLNSTVNISGSGNSISATATGSGGYAYGISAYLSSTVNISGSGNSISAIATGGSSEYGDGNAYGIGAWDSIVNFANTATGTTITVGGSTDTWGIYASSDSDLQIGGKSVGDDLDRFEREHYITFHRTGNKGSLGDKIQWGSKDLPWE